MGNKEKNEMTLSNKIQDIKTIDKESVFDFKFIIDKDIKNGLR